MKTRNNDRKESKNVRDFREQERIVNISNSTQDIKEDISLLRFIDNYLYLLYVKTNSSFEFDRKIINDNISNFESRLVQIVNGEFPIERSSILPLILPMKPTIEEFLIFSVLLIIKSLRDESFVYKYLREHPQKILKEALYEQEEEEYSDSLRFITKAGRFIRLKDIIELIRGKVNEDYAMSIIRLEEYGFVKSTISTQLYLTGSETLVNLSDSITMVLSSYESRDSIYEDSDDCKIIAFDKTNIKYETTTFEAIKNDLELKEIFDLSRHYYEIYKDRILDTEPLKILLYGNDYALMDIISKMIAADLAEGIMTYKYSGIDSSFLDFIRRRKGIIKKLEIDPIILEVANFKRYLLRFEFLDNRKLSEFPLKRDQIKKLPFICRLPVFFLCNKVSEPPIKESKILGGNYRIFKIDGLSRDTALQILSHLLNGYSVDPYLFSDKEKIDIFSINMISEVIKREVYYNNRKLDNDLLFSVKKSVMEASEKDQEDRLEENEEYENKRDKILIETDIREKISDVVLNPQERETIDNIILAAKNMDKLYNKDSPLFAYGRGLKILFYGPPGTGKTLTARAIAREVNLPIIAIHYPNLLDCFVGKTEKLIKKHFETAEKNNAILFFDECDAITMSRGNLHYSWEFSFLNTFLKELEDFNGILILSTNFEKIRDSALNRRIHFFVKFENPDYENRVLLLKRFIPEPILSTIDIDHIASFAFNGGHIKNVAIKLKIELLKGNQIDTDFLTKILKTELSKENKAVDSNKIGF